MPWDISNMFWVIALIVFIILEAFTAGIVSIWFAIGSLAALVAATCGLNPVWQVSVFLVVSALTLAFTRPIMKNWLNVKVTKTNVDAVLGETGVVTKPILVNEYGEVKVGSQRWTAKGASDDPIALHEQVEVIAIEGVKLIVRRLGGADRGDCL